jgi:uncharacterized coiled-coil protein SlyX
MKKRNSARQSRACPYTLTEVAVLICVVLLVIAIVYGFWKLATTFSYHLKYKSQVAEQIEQRVAPLEKKVAELQEILIEESNLRHAQTEIMDKMMGCMEKLEAKGSR